MKEKVLPKDYDRFLFPLEGKFKRGIRDFPEALWLQIESTYWYWEHDEFLEYYNTHPEFINTN